MTSSTDSSSDNEPPINDSWSNLKTNKQFDGKLYLIYWEIEILYAYIYLKFHNLCFSEETNRIVRRKSLSTGIDEIDTGKPVFLDVLTPSTPYSLLVQSLVKQLCNFIEGNK
jgi:hypothetical protein